MTEAKRRGHMDCDLEHKTGRTARLSECSVSDLTGVRILIVDDHPANRMVIGNILNAIGGEIEETSNGKEALNALSTKQYDLVLLDRQMPIMNGLETMVAIRNRTDPWRNIPVIALTADATQTDRELFQSLGMNGYVSKPIDVNCLVSEVVRVLGNTPL